MKKLVTLLLVVTLVAVVLAVVFGTQKSALDKELTVAKADIETANKNADAVLADVDALTKKVAELEAAAAEKASELETAAAKVTELEAAVAEKATQVDATSAEKATVDEALTAAKAELEAAQTAKTQAEEALAEAQKTFAAEKEAMTAESAALNAAKADAELAVANLASEKAEIEKKIAELEKSKADAEAAAAALTVENTELKATVETLTAELATANAALADAQTALTEANAKLAELEATAAKVTELEAGAAAASAQVAALNAELAAAQIELDTVKTELEASKNTIQNATPKFNMGETVEVTIFHTNDVHSRVTDQIGYAKLAAIVNAEKEAGKNVLLADAGDTLHGMSIATLETGASIVSILNAAGYDVMTPGNHDFNYGYDRLKELEGTMDFALVNCTLMLADGSPAFNPYVVLESGGKKIAFVGACNPSIKTSIHPDRIGMLTFGNEELVEKTVAEVKDTVDAVVVLCHWGADEAYVPNSAVLAAIEGVDLVIDGHSHTELADIAQVEGNAPVVSAGEYLKNIGKVVLSFDANGVQVISTENIPLDATADVQADADVQKIIDDIKAAQDTLLAAVVGQTSVDLDGERATNRTSETNLGDLAADAILAYTEADFAFTNGGGIRATIPAGDITLKNMVDVFPFGNTVIVLEATGAQIKAAMEHGLRLYPEASGSFPQIAGGKVVFDPAKEAGSRVVSMEIGGKPVEDETVYTLATNDFIAAGGDGYALNECKKLLELGTLDEIFIEYIKTLGVVDTQIDGRMTMLETAVEEKPAA